MADKLGRKTGGRVRGTPNKATLNLEQRLEENGFDPVNRILTLLPGLDPPDQAKVIMQIWEYMFPKRKQLEHSLGDDEFKRALVQRIMFLNEENERRRTISPK